QYRPVADVQRIEANGAEVRAICRDGRRFEAAALVSTLDPKTTFLELLDAGTVPETIRVAAEAWRIDACGPFTAHYGIKGAPPRLATQEATEALVQVLGFADAGAVGDHLDAAATGQLPATPAGHLTVTSRHDPTQAAPGPFGPLHTLRCETRAPPCRAPWPAASTPPGRSARPCTTSPGGRSRRSFSTRGRSGCCPNRPQSHEVTDARRQRRRRASSTVDEPLDCSSRPARTS